MIPAIRDWLRNRSSPDNLGAAGERLARRRLRKAGHRVLARNLRTPIGEVDLITLAPDRRTIVFVEVKARMRDAGVPTPPPEASVTARKKRKLLALAHTITRQRGWRDRPIRIDVVAVDWSRDRDHVVRIYENAVTA